MPWEVVERHRGFKVKRIQATDTQAAKFVAEFTSKHVPNTELRHTVQEARDDGYRIVKQAQTLQQSAASAGQHGHAALPAAQPCRGSARIVHAPLLCTHNPNIRESHAGQGMQPGRKHQLLSTAQSASPSKKQHTQKRHNHQRLQPSFTRDGHLGTANNLGAAVQEMAAAVQRLDTAEQRLSADVRLWGTRQRPPQQHPSPASFPSNPATSTPHTAWTAAWAALQAHSLFPKPCHQQQQPGPLSNTLVQLLISYDPHLAGSHVLLGPCIGSGGFASVYLGNIINCTRGVRVNPSNCNQSLAAAPTAAVAAAPCAAEVPPLLAPSPAGAMQPGQAVAVKVYKNSKPGTTADVLNMYAEREIQALQLLQHHPNVVRLLARGGLQQQPDTTDAGSSTSAGQQDVGGAAQKADTSAAAPTGDCEQLSNSNGSGSSTCQHHSLKCAVLELLPCSLAQALQSVGRFPEPAVQLVVHQLLQLLEVMHSGALSSHIVVHRDLKPQNILMRADGSIAVADFGVCSVRELLPAAGQQQATAATLGSSQGTAQEAMCTAVGSPFYAAPELYAGPPATRDGSKHARHGFDASIDMFSVGVIALELLVGQLHGAGAARGMGWGADVPKTARQAKQWEETVRAAVDGEVQLLAGVVLSAEAREFVGCCCGLGRQWAARIGSGEAKRMSASELLQLPWMHC